MKRILIITFLLAVGFSKAQTTPYLGNWELCKVIILPADTQIIKKDDVRYVKYNFNYNNTFQSYHQQQKQEASGKWGMMKEDKKVFLKIRSHTFSKTKEGLPDYQIVLGQTTKIHFQQLFEKKGKITEIWIFCKVD